MNNENKRIKQINRIATPIKLNQNGEKIEEKKVVVNTQIKKENKIKLNTLLKIILIILVIAILICILIIFIPSISNKNELHYNDLLPTTKTDYPISTIYIDGGLDVYGDYSYDIDDNFSIKTTSNGNGIDVLINNVYITSTEDLHARVYLIDDLLLFSVSGMSDKTTKLYAVTKDGNIILDLYQIGDIDGMSLANENSISTNEYNMVLIVTRVLGHNIYYTNDINNQLYANVCDEESMFEASIETSKPIKIYYLLKYNGNHSFTLESEYEETLEHYINKNNLCN